MDATLRPLPAPSSVRRIAIVGTYDPRQCGIATFTGDLESAIRSLNSGIEVDLIAVGDRSDYEYPSQVRFDLPVDDKASYVSAAAFVNKAGYDAVSIQHEYGIFGGVAGDYLLEFVRALKVPVITTLHTVLDQPDPDQRRVMNELLTRSSRVIVMSKQAISILAKVHGTRADKVELIHHGIPDFAETVTDNFRASLNCEGPIILTFGLLSPGKGIEYGIRALPKIVARHPEATYFVVGATHPHVRRSEGEAYRASLANLAERLGVSANVRFVDEFVSANQLVKYLNAMDFYLTPYLNANQITSGTLAYALGAGKAVISTPYLYAKELLDEGRGTLVPFRDSESIADEILDLCSNPDRYLAMCEAAGQFGESMVWSESARQYVQAMEAVRAFVPLNRRGIARWPERLRALRESLPAPAPVAPRPYVARQGIAS